MQMQDPTNYIHSLRTIADAANREKRTVQNWYARAKEEHGELGILVNGVRLFTNEERDILTSYAGADRPDPLPEPDTPPVTVVAGNHHLVLAPPIMPQAFSLESLRSSEAVSFEDPLALANRALAIADQIQTAMDADLKARQQANEELKKRIQTMKLNQLKYEIQANILDSATTDRTISLQDSLAELARLGKPPAEQTAAHGA
jgi:hypothetical protein